MSQQRIARTIFATTAVAVFAGLVIQVYVSANLQGARFTSVPSLIFNVFCYFTVQSNVIVGVTTALLARRLDHPSTTFRVFRLAGLVAITITFVVFHQALAALQDLHGAAAVADLLLHTVVPVLVVLGWVAFGPRGMVTWRVAGLAVVFPVCWVAFALVRGALIDFYPYPFVDVHALGYLPVIGNVVIIGVLFFALAAAAVVLDRRLPRLAPPQTTRGPFD